MYTILYLQETAPPGEKEYNYLLSQKMWNLTRERKQKLLKERDEKINELNQLKGSSVQNMWRDDLDVFMEAYMVCTLI